VARTIRDEIRQELNLTASAGVAPNKFLAKLASDWRKPDGIFVIQPDDVDTFLLPLPVRRLPGVGKVTGEKLEKLEIKTVGTYEAWIGPRSNSSSVILVSGSTSLPAASTRAKWFPIGQPNPSLPRTPSSTTYRSPKPGP
jgi:hypothetical protein